MSAALVRAGTVGWWLCCDLQPLSVLNTGQACKNAEPVEAISQVSELEYPAGRPTQVPSISSVHGPLITVKAAGGGGPCCTLPPLEAQISQPSPATLPSLVHEISLPSAIETPSGQLVPS